MIDDPTLFYHDFGVQATANGSTFAALLDTVGKESWDAAAISTHTLRYPNRLLSAGDTVTIDAHTYKVLGIPRELNPVEKIADLVLQS